MDQNTTLIVAIIILVVVVAALARMMWQRRRSETLRERYGPEYERAVQELGDRRQAEAELLKRKERVEHLDIRPLPPAERTRFADAWRGVQARFVDDPRGAVMQADSLVEEVMKTRGYPVADFDQRAADLSVHHPRVVENYRAAREVAIRHRRGEAGTEDLRKAMVHYRELFEDLLEDAEHTHKEVAR
ncbi:MAG TPA: hypothetical protein VFS05_13305 [Gemmatimonadaceae bacterium]|nr:hypothetical protein [Gemmatimonadaceae bacterium]